MIDYRLTFYGVRGSYPVSGKKYLKYGGNTASLLLESNEELIIFDAGTGLINIGKYIMQKRLDIKKINIFLTHLHSDHIVGLPFFYPVFKKDYKINIYCYKYKSVKVKETVLNFFNPPLSPISQKGIKANINFFELDKVVGEIKINKSLSINYTKVEYHPIEGVLLYSINFLNNYKVVYATDIEIPEGFCENGFELTKNSNIMIIDSQYLDKDYYNSNSKKIGFGHNTVSMAINAAIKANVEKMYLFHYEPEYSDKTIDRMYEFAKKRFKNTIPSKEGGKILIRR